MDSLIGQSRAFGEDFVAARVRYDKLTFISESMAANSKGGLDELKVAVQEMNSRRKPACESEVISRQRRVWTLTLPL